MSDKSIIKKQKVILVMIIFCICMLVSTTFAAVLFYSYAVSSGSIATHDVNSSVSLSASKTSLSFTKAGQKQEIELELNNYIVSPVQHTYSLSYTYGSGTDTITSNLLADAIFVYYDGEYVDTLSSLTNQNGGKIEAVNLVPAAVKSGDTITATTDVHKLTFELHIAAQSSLYSGKSLNVKIVSEAKTADYSKYIFVATNDEFMAAIEDVNSGLLDKNVKIVLGADVALTQDMDLNFPCTFDLLGHKLDLNGYTLTIKAVGETETNIVDGEEQSVDVPAVVTLLSSKKYAADFINQPTGVIALNSSTAVLDIRDFMTENNTLNMGRSYSNLVSVLKTDESHAINYLLARFQKRTLHQVAANAETDAFGALSFYLREGISFSSTDGIAISDGILTTPVYTVTSVAKFTLTSENSVGESEYKILASENDAAYASLLTGALLHLETLMDTVDGCVPSITSNLFLPQEIKKLGATIEWASDDEATMDNTGKISNSVGIKTPVNLYATIRINGSVYTKKYSFLISCQNNQTRFNNFLAELSPVDLTDVYQGNNEDKAFLYMPVVDSDYSSTDTSYTGYDYRHAYICPNTESANPLDWAGYDDINLKSLTYSALSTYDYVSVAVEGVNRAIYLNTPVFNTFAQVKVAATFMEDVDENGEDVVYEGVVNIIIHPGSYAELLNMVFDVVDEAIQKVDIYQNIVDTRTINGYNNEKGDFILPTRYKDSDKYTIEYFISSNVVKKIKVNDDNTATIVIDPLKFSTVPSTALLKVKVSYTASVEQGDPVSAEREMPFAIPAAYLPNSEGFENYSVFSSLQYQVWRCLPEPERTNQQGTSGYDTGFSFQGNVMTNINLPYILLKDIEKCDISTLKFYVESESQAAEGSSSEVYKMLRLLEWATGKNMVAASEVFGSVSGLSSRAEYDISYGLNYAAIPSSAVQTSLSVENQTSSGNFLYYNEEELKWQYYGFTAGTPSFYTLTFNGVQFKSAKTTSRIIYAGTDGNLSTATSATDASTFVFLTATEVASMQDFLNGTPTQSLSLGEQTISNLTNVSNAYYLYNPETNQFLNTSVISSSNTAGSRITLSKNYSDASMYRIYYYSTYGYGIYSTDNTGSAPNVVGLNLDGADISRVCRWYLYSGGYDQGSFWTISNATYSSQKTIVSGSETDGPYDIYYKTTDGTWTLFSYAPLDDTTITFSAKNTIATVVVSEAGFLSKLQTISDGKEYLNPDETAVVKAYYELATGGKVGAASWDSFWGNITTTPDGRIVSDGKGLSEAAVDLCRTYASSDVSGTYFKHYEMLLWAINEKDEVAENGKYNYPNSASMTQTGTYDVLLSTGATRTYTFTSTSGTDRTNGTSVFMEDNTSYISPGEEAVLRHFWYGKTNGNSSARDDFYQKVFLPYTTFPTYLNNNAVSTIVRNLYEALGYTQSTDYSSTEGFSASCTLIDGVYYPNISSAENSFGAIRSFTSLSDFTLSGSIELDENHETANLPAFLTTSALSTFFSRLTTSNKTLTRLTLRNLAQNYTEFDLKGLAEIPSVVYMDLGVNYGITNIGYILDGKYKKLNYLDICGANEKYRYMEFVLQAIYNLGMHPTIYYTEDDSSLRMQFTQIVENFPEELTYLREFNKIDSKYLQLLQNVYSSNGSTNVIWQIEDGNKMTSQSEAGSQYYDTENNQSTISEMESLRQSYFYCSQSFGNYLKGHIYQYSLDTNANLVFTDTGNILTATDVSTIPSTVENYQTDNSSFEKTSESQISSNSEKSEATSETLEWTSRHAIYMDGSIIRLARAYRLQYVPITITSTITYRIFCTGKVNQTQTITYYHMGSVQTMSLTDGNAAIIPANSAVNVKYIHTVSSPFYIDVDSVQTTTFYAYTSYSTQTSGTSYTTFTTSQNYFKTGTNSKEVYVVYHSAETATEYLTRLKKYDDSSWTVNNYSFLSSYSINGNTLSGISSTSQIVEGSSYDAAANTMSYGAYSYTAIGAAIQTEGIESVQILYSNLGALSSESAAQSFIDRGNAHINDFYRYTGASDIETSYYNSVETTISYTRNSYYYLSYDEGSGRLVFTLSSLSFVNIGATNNGLEGILQTANNAKTSSARALYYGRYYHYTGATITVNGHTYTNNRIYRLLYTPATEFYFEDTGKSCTSISNQDLFIKNLYDVLDATSSIKVGDVFYLSQNATNWMYASGYYILIQNEENGTYQLRSFSSLDETDTNRISNERVYNTQYYSGTGGSQEAEISATVIINGVEYTRYFHITVVGIQ